MFTPTGCLQEPAGWRTGSCSTPDPTPAAGSLKFYLFSIFSILNLHLPFAVPSATRCNGSVGIHVPSGAFSPLPHPWGWRAADPGHRRCNRWLMSPPLLLAFSSPTLCPCIISVFDKLQTLACSRSSKKPLNLGKGQKIMNWFNSTYNIINPQDQYLHLNLAQQNGLNLLPMPYYPGTMPWYPTAPGIIPSTPTTPGILQNGAQPR